MYLGESAKGSVLGAHNLAHATTSTTRFCTAACACTSSRACPTWLQMHSLKVSLSPEYSIHKLQGHVKPTPTHGIAHSHYLHEHNHFVLWLQCKLQTFDFFLFMDSSFCKGLETAAYTKTKRWTTRRLWEFVLPDIISLNCGGVLARAKSTSHASHTAHTSHSTHASSKEGFKKIKWIRLHAQPFIAHCQILLGDQNCGLKETPKRVGTRIRGHPPHRR